MTKTILIFISAMAISFASLGQSDSLVNKLLEGLPKDLQERFRKEYKKPSGNGKKLILDMTQYTASTPRSSKKQLMQNIDTNYNSVKTLKDYFTKVVLSGYFIYIEFHKPDGIISHNENIDFWLSKTDTSTKQWKSVFQTWNVELQSSELDSLLQLASLTRNNLKQLKLYLDKANCISVLNKEQCEIGYARSGLGKYSYLIFDNPLTDKEKKEYNNGCEFIFYKDNIVLTYGSGAGSQCFPD